MKSSTDLTIKNVFALKISIQEQLKKFNDFVLPHHITCIVNLIAQIEYTEEHCEREIKNLYRVHECE